VAVRKVKAQFIEPMLLMRSGELLEGPAWIYELKLDGYRAIGFKSDGKVHLRSHSDKDFNGSYPEIARALGALPDEAVIAGEVVALPSRTLRLLIGKAPDSGVPDHHRSCCRERVDRSAASSGRSVRTGIRSAR
jgi:hypothetical protein